MPILRSYYQEVYRSPVVRLDGYSGRHGLEAGILAYLDFGGATGTSKDGLAETMLAFATERGGLLSYGTDRDENYRRAAVLVDKILRGAMPGDLPVEQPERFELIVNMKTAKAIGVTLSPAILLRATQVIE